MKKSQGRYAWLSLGQIEAGCDRERINPWG